LDAIHNRPGVYHYASKAHGLERRADLDPLAWAALTAAFPEGSHWLFCGCDKIRFEAARDLPRKTITAEVIPSTLADMEAEWQRYLKGLKLELRQKLATKAAGKGG